MPYALVFLPLISSIICYFGKSLGNLFSQILSSSLVFISAVISIFIFFDGIINNNYGNYLIFEWISSGDFKANWSINIDPLSSVMLVVVTSVSALVHIYSIGYMSHDPHKPRFMSYLSLFTFSMLALVVSDNFLQLFFGWEGVGLCSYLLIGFWYKKETANNAAIKAFIVNRIGDFGLATKYTSHMEKGVGTGLRRVDSLCNPRIDCIRGLFLTSRLAGRPLESRRSDGGIFCGDWAGCNWYLLCSKSDSDGNWAVHHWNVCRNLSSRGLGNDRPWGSANGA